jgi:hypothetical protein
MPEGVSLAPDDDAWEASPDWERLDETYNVRSWSIDRGRPNEMSRTDTGTAVVELVDQSGDFDPTNTGSPFYGRFIAGQPMGPLVQAAISLQNPVTETWATLFRGFIGSIQWVPYRSEQHANVTLELVDGLALLAACEMPLDGTFGHAVIDSNIVYNEDTDDTEAVKTRIGKVLDEVGWPGSMRSLFTGNVTLQKKVYAPRSTALQVIQDAAEAEFPDQANFYVGGPRRPGYMVFRGRFARFNPDTVEYDITTWQLGDDQAAEADPGDVVRVSPPLVASLDDTLLYSSAYATPQDPEGNYEVDFPNQYVTDTAARDRYGLRTWSAENLATLGGAGSSTALAETKLFADYVRDNYAVPRVRVGQLTIKPRRPDSVYGPATWQLMCNVDISDIVHLTTTHGGGGGFDHDFYVEGIHYQARPGGTIPYVELTLDVSPRGYYDSSPFET